MDISATNFQAAWLDAVHRIQAHQPPIPDRPRHEDTLTDMLEDALRAAGPDSAEHGWTDPRSPGRQVDRLV